MEIEFNVIQEIWKSIKTLNDHSGELTTDVAILKSQMASMVWWFRAIASALVIMLISQGWQMFKINKNGNGKK